FCKIYVAASAGADMNNALTNQTSRIILLHRHFNLPAGAQRAAAALAVTVHHIHRTAFHIKLPTAHRYFTTRYPRRSETVAVKRGDAAAAGRAAVRRQ